MFNVSRKCQAAFHSGCGILCVLCAVLCWVVSDSWWPRGLDITRLLCPRDFPGMNTGVAYHFLFWGQVGGGGAESSRPRNWNWVSCIEGRFFTNWATRDLVSLHFFTHYFLKYTFNFRMDSDRQISCKESTKRSMYPQPVSLWFTS